MWLMIELEAPSLIWREKGVAVFVISDFALIFLPPFN